MNHLNKLTTANTAFHTWDDLMLHLQAGYVPTLSVLTRRERLLAKAIRAHGFRVFVRETGSTY